MNTTAGISPAIVPKTPMSIVSTMSGRFAKSPMMSRSKPAVALEAPVASSSPSSTTMTPTVRRSMSAGERT